MKLAGPAAEGACATALGADVNKLPTASKFVNAFKAKYKESPQQYSVFAYEDMHIIIRAIEKAGKKDRAEILKAVRQVTPYDGRARQDRLQRARGHRQPGDRHLLREGRQVGVPEGGEHPG